MNNQLAKRAEIGSKEQRRLTCEGIDGEVHEGAHNDAIPVGAKLEDGEVQACNGNSTLSKKGPRKKVCRTSQMQDHCARQLSRDHMTDFKQL